MAQAVLEFLQVQLVQQVLVGQGAPGDLGFLLVLVHPEVHQNKRLSAGRANPSHHQPKDPSQVSLAETEELEASPR